MSAATNAPAVRNGGGKTPAREDARVATVRNLLERMEPQIKRALPKFMDARRMTRLALTAIRTNQDLLACTPESLIGEVQKAAEVGLEINGILGHAYLVPYRNNREGIYEAKLLVGYKGLIVLGRRSRQVDTIQGQAVYEADDFDYEYGSHEFLRHRPSRSPDKGKVVGAWAMTRFRGASHPQFEFLDVPTIESRRARSRQSHKGPWVTDYAAMCVKTAYRQHSKVWPLSPIERALIETEELIESGVELPESEPTDLDAPVLEAPPTRSSRVADALEGKAAGPAESKADDDYDDWELSGEKGRE